MKRLLISPLALLCLLPLSAYAQTPYSRLNAKQLAKAESLVDQLNQLDAFLNTGPETAQFRTRIGKLSEGYNRTAASLPDGDEKTDIASALYWYQQMAISLNHASASRFSTAVMEERCGSERPGAYQKLCESISGSARDLIWAKARLHLKWASAGLVFQKTGHLDRPLDDVAVERKIDQTLAARVLESLRILEREVIVYRSLGDFEASGKLARVSLAVFKSDLEKVSAEAERALSWLPQNRLKNELSNALHSFQDGAFWWEQIDQPRVVKAFDLVATSFTQVPSAASLIATVPYTIAINWRQGSEYLKRAEKIIGA